MNKYVKNIIDTIKEFNWKVEDLWIDDNTGRPREEVMNRLWELRGDTPELVTYKWEFTSKEALEKWKENKK